MAVLTIEDYKGTFKKKVVLKDEKGVRYEFTLSDFLGMIQDPKNEHKTKLSIPKFIWVEYVNRKVA